SELCPGGTGHTCRLSAGEHSSLGFGDGISFTLDGDWIVRANETDVISLESGVESNPSVLELITGALRFESSTPKTFHPVTDPTEVQRRLQALVMNDTHPIVSVRPGTTIGDAAALVFDVTTEHSLPLFWYPVTEHQSSLVSGRTARFLWSTRDGAPFIVAIESDTRQLDTLVEQVRPILDSLEFGDGD
ncbi:MAG TPA: hypothetical protein VFI15_07380, partial [Candidatus Limnocylindrales bacterium]|nr:hypothetical protein [Candidatus Limnocylindrales bacterium]